MITLENSIGGGALSVDLAPSFPYRDRGWLAVPQSHLCGNQNFAHQPRSLVLRRQV